MTVEEVKELKSLSAAVQDAIELNPELRYIFRCKERLSMEQMERLRASIKFFDPTLKVMPVGPEFEIFEIKP